MIPPNLLKLQHHNSFCVPNGWQSNHLQIHVSNQAVFPIPVLQQQMPMTPILKHSQMNSLNNPLGLPPESTPLSIISQISTGTQMNNIPKRKQKRANSHDEFCLGILDKDDEVDELDMDMQPTVHHHHKAPVPYEVVL